MFFLKSLKILTVSIISISILAEDFIYKVKKGDNLSTIIYSSSDDNIQKSIQKHTIINKIKDKNKILQDDLLILSLDKRNTCNTKLEGSHILIEEKIIARSSKIKKNNECSKLLKYENNSLEQKPKNKRFKGVLMAGRETFKLNNIGPSFKGDLSTKHNLGYFLSYKLLDKPKYSFSLEHGLNYLSFENLKTMGYNRTHINQQNYSLNLMLNQELVSPFLRLIYQEELFFQEKKTDLLVVGSEFLTKIALGFTLNLSSFSIIPEVSVSEKDKKISLDFEQEVSPNTSILLRTSKNQKENLKSGSIFLGLIFKN